MNLFSSGKILVSDKCHYVCLGLVSVGRKFPLVPRYANDMILFGHHFFRGMGENPDNGSPKAKRKKELTGNEILAKLKKNENDVSKAVREMIEELCPFDINDEEALGIEDRLGRCEKVANLLKKRVRKLQQQMKERKFKHKPELLDEKLVSSSQYSLLDSQEGGESEVENGDDNEDKEKEASKGSRPEKYRKKPLDQDMSMFTRRRRVADKRETFLLWAEEEGVSVTKLLGYLLHLENWPENRDEAGLGWKLFQGAELSGKPEMTLEEVIWIREKSGMSEAVMQELRLKLLDRYCFHWIQVSLQFSYRIWIPPSNLVREENMKHRPDLQEYSHGVMASLPNCISLTLTERIQLLDLSGLQPEDLSVYFSFRWGLDGSGDHSDYAQLSKSDYTTKQVMSVCFAIKDMKVVDTLGKQVNWSSSELGANRPQNTRPLAVFPAKESSALLQDFVPRVESDIRLIKDEGIVVRVKDHGLTAQCECSKLSMADGKMTTTLLNLGGAYCTMCTKDQQECQKVSVIEGGFLMDRSVESIAQLALSLQHPDTGDIIKKKGDYKQRAGVCGQPITEDDMTKHIPVCHAKIRVFEFTMELVKRELSHQKWYTPTNGVVYTKDEKELYKSSGEVLKEKMKKGLGINIADPGDMVTGAAFQSFSSDFARSLLCSMLDHDKQKVFSEILLGLCTLVKVINSQKRKVDVDRVRALGQQVYLQLVQLFPWIVVSPSVHRILAHSWEVILQNDCYGLGSQSEEGLEALNKFILRMRSRGARKDSTLNNFTDTYNHLWDRSRPIIVEMERVIKRRPAKLKVSTEIESMVESMFAEEED